MGAAALPLMLIDLLSAVQLKLSIGLDILDCPPKCPTLEMTAIRVAEMVLMINQAKVPVSKLQTVDVPNIPSVIDTQFKCTKSHLF